MRYAAILGMVCLGVSGFVMGCGPSDGGAGGGGNAATTSSSSSGGGMAGMGGMGGMGVGGMGGMASGGGGTGGMEPMINGCQASTAEDHTADPVTNVGVGQNGFTFDPACIRIKKGSQVTFAGNFTSHPMVGGEATLPPKPDGSSPIPQTNSGSSVTVTFGLAGTYPYYCEYHTPTMAGAVFVVP